MIDLYCERLGPGIWAEPVNALTNLAFLVAAFAAWRLQKTYRVQPEVAGPLIGLIVAIGIGSGLFHTFATGWARILDVLPILLFQVLFFWIYGRWIIRLRLIYLSGLVILYLVAAYAGRQFPHLLNGSLIYLPAFLLLAGLALFHYRHVQTEPLLLLWATAAFSLSLFMRSIDMAVCDYFPIGTHFFWHLLNGLTVYLAARALFMNMPTTEGAIER